MVTNDTPTDWSGILVRGVAGGIVGGILLALFLFVVLVLPNHGTFAGLLTMDAHNVRSANPLVGLLAHLAVSIGWGIGYAYVASTRPNVRLRPWLSGIVYGCVVWLLMQFVLMLGGVWPGLTLATFAAGIVAHALFFGVPVALTVRAMSRDAA